MPGTVSDSYDPVWGTGDNYCSVCDGLQEAIDAIDNFLGPSLKDIINVAQGEPGPTFTLNLSEREIRLLRFGARQALESFKQGDSPLV